MAPRPLAAACLATLALAAFGPGCSVPRATPEALLQTGFRSPEQTFRTFQSALASDLIDLEYRCFGTAFKRREGLTQLAWRAYRAELLDTWPLLRRLATAEILSSQAVADGRWALVGRVRYLWYEQDFRVELVREDFFELYEGAIRATDGSLEWDGLVSVEGDAEGWPPPTLTATVPLPGPIDATRLTELRIGREWKIDRLEPIEP